VILPGTAIFGLILLSSKVLGNGIGYFYVFFIALGIIQGCTSPVSYSIAVSHWFNRRRGLALGCMLFGVGLGAIAVPLVAQRLIVMFGWRVAYVASGCAALLISLPVAAKFLIGDPKEQGLSPDGIIAPVQTGPREMRWKSERSRKG
jgi:sugar phosphate permease